MIVRVRWFIAFFFLSIVLNAFYAHHSFGEVQYQANAKAAVLFDVDSHQFLLEQDADKKIAPASFTKVMTLYLAQDALQKGLISLDDEVYVSKKAWKTNGSKMFIEVGKRVPITDIFKGIAVVSGNDACVALSEHMAGKEDAFVEQMNLKAKSLGLINTAFQTSNGLPAEGQYTTARDMTLLSHYYIKDHPNALGLHSLQEFTYNNITQENRNRLLKLDDRVDGLKTGYIEEAGYHLIATATQDARRLIAVVMGAKSWRDRENEALKLLNYGFRNFILQEVVKEGAVIETVPVQGGKYDTVDLVAPDTMVVSVFQHDQDYLNVINKIPSSIVAPVRKGEVLGKVIVEVNGKQLHQVNLLAKQAVPKGWQAYWQYGIVILGILGLLYIFYRTTHRKKPTNSYQIN